MAAFSRSDQDPLLYQLGRGFAGITQGEQVQLEDGILNFTRSAYGHTFQKRGG